MQSFELELLKVSSLEIWNVLIVVDFKPTNSTTCPLENLNAAIYPLRKLSATDFMGKTFEIGSYKNSNNATFLFITHEISETCQGISVLGYFVIQAIVLMNRLTSTFRKNLGLFLPVILKMNEISPCVPKMSFIIKS